jgi:hypothetical protein
MHRDDRNISRKTEAKGREKQQHAGGKDREVQVEDHPGAGALDRLVEQVKRANDASEASEPGKRRREKAMIGLVGLTAFFAGITYFVFRAQLEDSHTAYAAVQRAFVFDTSFVTPCEARGCMLAPMWENSGSTPTEELTVVSGGGPIELSQSPLAYSFYLNRDVQKSLIGPHGKIRGEGIPITRQEIEDVRGHRSQFWVWGRAIYRDVFDKSEGHVTCYAYNVIPVFSMEPMKPGSAETQSVFKGFDLVAMAAHNCSDKDCKADPHCLG